MIAFPNLGIEFKINNVAFVLFGQMNIYWYTIIVGASIFLAIGYALLRSKRFGMIADKVFDTAFVGFIGGLLGARLYFVIFSDSSFNIVTFFTGIRDGGLAIYGGIIGAVLFAIVFMKLKNMKMLPVLDMAGIAFLLGIGLGRWGNFFNQEAYGAVTTLPWGMTGSGIGAVPVHPCFLYESLWCLLGFALLHFYSKKLHTFDGEMFLLFAAWYGIGRFFIESLRADSLMLGSFRISQTVAALTAGIAIGAFIAFKQNTLKKPRLYSLTEDSAASIAAYEENIRLNKEKAEAIKALKKADETAPSILGDVGRDAPGAPSVPDAPSAPAAPENKETPQEEPENDENS
jgi:phosphatidylglycerol:prolipoprotein diacylglycerol transferase